MNDANYVFVWTDRGGIIGWTKGPLSGRKHFSLFDPAKVDFIHMPSQSSMGSPGIITFTVIAPFNLPTIAVDLEGTMAIYEGDDAQNPLIVQYLAKIHPPERGTIIPN